MRMVTLIEDRAGDKGDLLIEHGLSVYIELDGKKILFDTGDSDKFLKNAEALAIDLKDLDYVFISHGHYDHSGGFQSLIKEVKPNAKLIVGKGFFKEKYSQDDAGDYLYRGNRFDQEFLKENDIEVKFLEEDVLEIKENLLVFTNFDRDAEFENSTANMYVKRGEVYEKDTFADEISIAIKTDKGLVVIVGCSHPGIVNILDTIIKRTGMDIYALIGGTHLIGESGDKINKVIAYLKDKGIRITGACHCTGEKALSMMEEQLGDRFVKNNLGSELKI